VTRSTKFILLLAAITAFAALAVWLGGLTGPRGSGKISLQGTVIETGAGSFKLFCPGGSQQTIVPDKNCKLFRVKHVGLENVPADRLAEVKGMVQTNQTAIAARSMTVYPAGKNPEEELTAYRATGALIKRGKSLALKTKGKELAIQAGPGFSAVVQDSPDPSDPALDSVVEVRGHSDWWSIKADEIIVRRSGPDVKDTPGLPRVLFLGGPTGGRSLGQIRKALSGIANVHQAGAGWENTDSVLENLDNFLGPYQWKRTRWAVIHFNFGLGDLRLVNGKNRIPLEKYSQNIQTLLDRLGATDAKLIWATIPPLRSDRPHPDLRAEDISQYNAAAKKIMEQNHIEINDLAALLPAAVPGQAKPPARNKVIADQTVASVKKALGQP
jgi:hypothetical protein